VRDLAGMFFVEFVVELIDLHCGLVQSLPAGSRDLVDPASAASNIFEDRLQETASFQAMQKGVESSGPDAIPVVRQFLHHRKAEDGFLRRMYEYVNPYQSEKEFSLVTGHESNIYLCLDAYRIDSVISDFDSIMLDRGGGKGADELSPSSLLKTDAVPACRADGLPAVGTRATVSNR
jgi:hypothetical protein